MSACEASFLIQGLHNLVEILIVHDHSRISHIKLEAGNSLINHILDFFFGFLIPLYNRHMERIVAGAFTICLFVPFREAFL